MHAIAGPHSSTSARARSPCPFLHHLAGNGIQLTRVHITYPSAGRVAAAKLTTFPVDPSVAVTAVRIEKIVNALGKIEDVRLSAEKLSDLLPEASKDRERADELEDVFMVYTSTLLPYLEGARTMTIAQRNLIRDIARKVENTEKVLRSIDVANNPRNADLTNSECALSSAEVVEEYQNKFRADRDAGDGATDGVQNLDDLCSLATLLHKGAKGVPTTPVRAVELYSRCVDREHVASMKRLAAQLPIEVVGVLPQAHGATREPLEAKKIRFPWVNLRQYWKVHLERNERTYFNSFLILFANISYTIYPNFLELFSSRPEIVHIADVAVHILGNVGDGLRRSF